MLADRDDLIAWKARHLSGSVILRWAHMLGPLLIGWQLSACLECQLRVVLQKAALSLVRARGLAVPWMA